MKKQIRKDKRKRKKARDAWTSRMVAKAAMVDQRSSAAHDSGSSVRGREGSRTLVRNRCLETGYARSIIRWYRLTGSSMRNLARSGQRPGVYKRSW